MQTQTIGTAPQQIFPPNAHRARWTLTFTPSSIAPGNTGHVFVGRGFIPNAVIGDPNQGDVLNAGSQIEEKETFPGDPSVWDGAIWIVSDTAAQQITIDEQSSKPVTT